MNKLTKKIVAIVTTITCAVWMMGPGVANALTVAELQTLINDLMAQITALQSQITEMEGGEVAVTGCTITSFDRALKVGMSGDDVKCLQIVLNSASDTQLNASGVGSPGNETSYFGPLTKAGVIKFQEKYTSEILAEWGLTSGTGYVGSTTRAKLNTLLSAGVAEEEEEEEEEEEVPTVAAVSIAADTPVTAPVAKGAIDVSSLKLKFTAGSEAYTVSKVVVSRGGVSKDSDVSAIKLYDGTTQLGSTQALNTNTHKATFSSLSWEVPANTVKYLTIKVNIYTSATQGDSIQLGVVLASDITSTATAEGTFPMWSNAITVTGVSVGVLNVDVQRSLVATTTVISGATDQAIAAWRFEADSTEGFDVHKIKITHVGTGARGDISNIVLKYAGVQIGETVTELDANNSATFDLSGSPLSILAASSKTVYAYADIAAGIWTARTVKFEITQYTDITAYGSNSGGSVTPTYSTGTAFVKQTGSTMTVSQGTLTVTLDAATNPASQSYVKGTENRKMTAIKFSVGSVEGVRVTKMVLTLTGISTDISNVTLWDGSTQVAGPASVIGTSVSFGANTIGWDTTGLFDIEASHNKSIMVKADVPSGASSTNQIALSLTDGNLYVDGSSSRYDVPSASITISSVTGNNHTISAKGTLVAALSSLTQAAQTYVIGSEAKEFAKVNITAGSGEDVTVSAIVVDAYEGASTANGAPSSSHHLTNMKILRSDGTQYGTTYANPTSASTTFSGTMNIAAGETETLSMVADVPLSSYPRYIKLLIDGADITCTGVSSAATITATGSGEGKEMTISYGNLTVAAAATPADQNAIIGETQVPYLGIIFTAGTAEDVRITSIILNQESSGTILVNEGTTTDFSHIALYDGATRLTSEESLTNNSSNTVSFTASEFLNAEGITITKGQQKIITVKADVPTTASSSSLNALGIATSSDISAVGLASNQDATVTLTAGPGSSSGVNYLYGGSSGDLNEVTLAALGTLAVTASADTPEKGMVAIGSYTTGVSNVVFVKYDFKAALEDIDITSIKVTRLNNRDVDFATISLWDGSTQLGGSQALVSATTTFNFTADSYWRIPAGTTKVLTVKANLNGVETANNAGARTGDAPKLCLSYTGTGLEIGTQGVSSGSTAIYASGSAFLCGEWQIIHQSKPTISAASLPSTAYGAGEKVLYRWTATADSKGDIGWKKIVFSISGSVTIGTTGYTIGMGNVTSTQAGVYMSTSTDPGEVAINTLTVYDVAANDEITASSTPWVYNDYAGGAKIIFTADAEKVIAAGATKTYELRGNVTKAGIAGDSITTKIDALSSATTTGTFITVAGGAAQEATSTAASLVWTDRSGSGSTPADHSLWVTEDWTNDYKVSGIPTASLSLSK